MNDRMDKQDAELLRARSRTAFDAQAATYDEGMQGEHARRPVPARACGGDARRGRVTPPRACLTWAAARVRSRELVLSPSCRARASPAWTCRRAWSRQRGMRLGDRADVLLCDAERLPFRDGSFDAAWCNDSFHHYPDPERAAFQAWRVLAPGGTFVIGDAWQPAPARAIMNAWMPHSREGDVRIYSEAELRRILGTWFSDVSWRRVG